MKEKFKELQDKYPQLGNAVIFSKLVKGKKMSIEQIEPIFDNLVDKKEWQGTPKKQLLEFYSLYSGYKSSKKSG